MIVASLLPLAGKGIFTVWNACCRGRFGIDGRNLYDDRVTEVALVKFEQGGW